MSSLSALQSLLLQTPLSQLSSVLADIRGLLSPSNAHETGVSPTLANDFEASLPSLLAKFYHEQGKVVRIPGMEAGSVVAQEGQDVAQAEGEVKSSGSAVYRDEGKSKRFRLDPLAGTTSSADSYTVSSKDELRIELEKALQGYLREHYPDLDKSRTNEGACGAVWRGPLREVKVVKKAVRPSESGEGRDEPVRVDAVMEDPPSETTADPSADQDGQAEIAEAKESAVEEGSEDAAAVMTADESAAEPPSAAVAGTEKAEAIEEDEEEGKLVESDVGQAERYTIRIVSGKSNAANFWSGRLLSTYTYHPSSSTLTGSLRIQIHYYENGNVQLNTSSSSSVDLPLPSSFHDASSPTQRAKAIVQTIKKYETDYQRGIEETYEGLNEKAFKNLRRQLPVTRQKVDWDKVLNYRLGSDLAGAQQSR